MSKMPHVKVSASFYLKDAPKDRLGLRHESWNFGDEPRSLSELLAAFIYRFVQFYTAVMSTPTNELNAEIEKVRKAMQTLRVEEEQVE